MIFGNTRKQNCTLSMSILERISTRARFSAHRDINWKMSQSNDLSGGLYFVKQAYLKLPIYFVYSLSLLVIDRRTESKGKQCHWPQNESMTFVLGFLMLWRHTIATIILKKENISLSQYYSFKGLDHYHLRGQHGCMLAGVVLEK